ncbi:hypothetical protein ISCGN_018837 [Ixodes scapularis]
MRSQSQLAGAGIPLPGSARAPVEDEITRDAPLLGSLVLRRAPRAGESSALHKQVTICSHPEVQGVHAIAEKRVIVTTAVYPRIDESLHVDIQSTGQKSHCVNTDQWPSQSFVLIRQSDVDTVRHEKPAGDTCESRCLESGVSTDPESCGFARPHLAVRGFPESGEKGILVVESNPG